MPTTSKGITYPSSTDHTRLWEHFQTLAQNVNDLIAAAPVEIFETANDTTSSITYINGTLHGTAFTAPPSGKVYITFGGDVGNNGTAIGHFTALSDYVRTGSTVGAGTDVLIPDDTRAIKYYCAASTAGFRYQTAFYRHLVTGLTAGASYNVITQFKASHNTDTAAINDRRLLVEPVI